MSFATILRITNFGKINNELLFLSVFLLITYFILFVLKKIIVIDTVVSFIEKDQIEIKLSHFFIQKIYFFCISDIKSYSFEHGNGYEIFKLSKRNDSKLKFLVFKEVKNLESFENFCTDFISRIENYNKNNKLSSINQKESIYKTKKGLLYGIIISISLISIPTINYLLETKVNIGVFLILYPAGILFLWNLYKERKK